MFQSKVIIGIYVKGVNFYYILSEFTIYYILISFDTLRIISECASVQLALVSLLEEM